MNLRSFFSLLLAASLVFLTGCSKYYDLHIDGQILAGPDQTLVAGVKVTLFAGQAEYATTTTDEEGRWSMTHLISAGEFDPAKDGKQEQHIREDFPYQFRIEAGDRNFLAPLPRVFAPKSGKDIFASVLVVIDAELERRTQE